MSFLPKTRIILVCTFLLLFAGILLFANESTIGYSRAIPNALPADRMDEYALGFSSHLPIMVMQTAVERLENEDMPPGAVIWYFDGSDGNRLTDEPAVVYANATANYRGNSSFSFPNPGYRLMFYDDDYLSALDTSFFGLEHANEWVLRTTYSDKSLIRDWFSYELAATVLDWQPRGGMVHLFRQDGKQGMIEYLGVFYLCQYIPAHAQAGLDVGEFSLADSDSIDFSGGGYVFQRGQGRSAGRMENGYRIMYPPAGELTSKQDALLRNEVHFYSQLIGNAASFHDAEDGCDFWRYIDINSCADTFLAGEIVKIAERGVASVFMYRRVGERLTIGPVWDCDGTMGQAHNPMQSRWYNFLKQEDDIFLNFLGCRAFSSTLAERYQAYRENIWSDEQLIGLFDYMVEYMEEPAAQHAERWPGKYDNEKQWAEEVVWMRSWLMQRLAWMDDHIEELMHKTPNEINNDFQSIYGTGE